MVDPLPAIVGKTAAVGFIDALEFDFSEEERKIEKPSLAQPVKRNSSQQAR